MSKKLYLGLVALIILLGVSAVLLLRDTDTEPAEQIALKPPPQGETFATGHWDGDKWHRTVPKEPETITYKGETLTLDELYSASFNKSWEERVVVLKRVIAEAPYSEYAYYARTHLAMRDEDGERIHDNALLFERLQLLLKHHPDSPRLLYDLLLYGRDIYPEEAIRYGEKALKYVEMYRMNSLYGKYPERIHHFLGYAYQEIGDYSTALEHLNQALKLYVRVMNAYSRSFKVKEHIEQLLEEHPNLETLPETDTEPAEQIALKPPPQRETFATGHWDGDKWNRTVPKEPETITYEGQTLTLDKLYNASFQHEKSWEERVAILKRIIAEVPYSKTAFSARLYLARHDENGKSIQDNALRFERLKPLLKYHPDSPYLLTALLFYSRRSHPEAAIRYGTEALKYVDMYRIESGYGAFPESIHRFLGYAYQEIGDDSTALEHLNQALKMYTKVYKDRIHGASSSRSIVEKHIEQIHIGNPISGPLSDGSVSDLPVRAPESKQAITEE